MKPLIQVLGRHRRGQKPGRLRPGQEIRRRDHLGRFGPGLPGFDIGTDKIDRAGTAGDPPSPDRHHRRRLAIQRQQIPGTVFRRRRGDQRPRQHPPGLRRDGPLPQGHDAGHFRREQKRAPRAVSWRKRRPAQAGRPYGRNCRPSIPSTRKKSAPTTRCAWSGPWRSIATAACRPARPSGIRARPSPPIASSASAWRWTGKNCTERIDRRAERMIENGLLAEVEELLKRYPPILPALSRPWATRRSRPICAAKSICPRPWN